MSPAPEQRPWPPRTLAQEFEDEARRRLVQRAAEMALAALMDGDDAAADERLRDLTDEQQHDVEQAAVALFLRTARHRRAREQGHDDPPDEPGLRDQLADALRAAFAHRITAEWICCDPPKLGHHLCQQGHAALEMVGSLLVDEPGDRSPILDAVLPIVADLQRRTEQAEDLLSIANETSNRSEAERACAVKRAEQAEARAYAAERAACICTKRSPEDYDGPLRDCPVHGEAAHWRQRAEQAEAAVQRVRRLCELTIAVSCRVQAIDQARDTLAALDRKETPVICEPCRDAADGRDRNLGHVPETCADHTIQPAGCACQHRPAPAANKPEETQ